MSGYRLQLSGPVLSFLQSEAMRTQREEMPTQWEPMHPERLSGLVYYPVFRSAQLERSIVTYNSLGGFPIWSRADPLTGELTVSPLSTEPVLLIGDEWGW